MTHSDREDLVEGLGLFRIQQRIGPRGPEFKGVYIHWEENPFIDEYDAVIVDERGTILSYFGTISAKEYFKLALEDRIWERISDLYSAQVAVSEVVF